MSIFRDVYLDCKAVPQNVLLSLITNRGVHSLVAYRVSRLFFRLGVPVLPLLVTRIIQIIYGVDISYKSDISPGVLIVHGVGLVIGNGVVIGPGVKLYHGVTLGISDSPGREDGFPVIERNVLIGTGACVLGPVRVGEGSVLGANTVVVRDVPPNSRVVGNPAKVLERAL